MEKKTAAQMLVPHIVENPVMGGDNKILVHVDTAIQVAEKYAAQETANMYTEQQVVEMICAAQVDAANGKSYTAYDYLHNKVHLKPPTGEEK